MKTTTCAMVLGCMALMMEGRSCLAVDTAANKSLTAINASVVALDVSKKDDSLRAWVESVKPAAGDVLSVHKETNYWDRSVRRENRRHLQE